MTFLLTYQSPELQQLADAHDAVAIDNILVAVGKNHIPHDLD